jgi:IS30 family transposase
MVKRVPSRGFYCLFEGDENTINEVGIASVHDVAADRQPALHPRCSSSNGHRADMVADAWPDTSPQPKQLRRSLTPDQRKQRAAHARFTVATGVLVYFCDPAATGNAAPAKTPTDCYARTSPRKFRSESNHVVTIYD